MSSEYTGIIGVGTASDGGPEFEVSCVLRASTSSVWGVLGFTGRTLSLLFGNGHHHNWPLRLEVIFDAHGRDETGFFALTCFVLHSSCSSASVQRLIVGLLFLGLACLRAPRAGPDLPCFTVAEPKS